MYHILMYMKRGKESTRIDDIVHTNNRAWILIVTLVKAAHGHNSWKLWTTQRYANKERDKHKCSVLAQWNTDYQAMKMMELQLLQQYMWITS